MATANTEPEHTSVEDELAQARERATKAEAELAALKGDSGKDDSGKDDSGKDDSGKGDSGSNSDIDPDMENGDAVGVKPSVSDAEEELRKDSMMAHLLDSLDAGEDIGHYGRLTFAMVARHFLPHDEVLGWLTKDSDFDEEKAEAMLAQVESSGYNPPKRDRILEWQKEQKFPIMPDPSDPDCGNLYRTLKFPDAVYKHIEEYREQKMHVA